MEPLEFVKEIRIDRELELINALTILAISKGINENSVVIFKAIGKSKQLSELLDNSNHPQKQSLKFTDRIPRVYNLLYSIDFIFPVLNFSLTSKEGDNPETTLFFSQKVKSVKFESGMIIPRYLDLIITYSYDPKSFSSSKDPIDLNLSKLMLPCYTVGTKWQPEDFIEPRKDKTPDMTVTINGGDVIIEIP
jgi:hypothetical protein